MAVIIRPPPQPISANARTRFTAGPPSARLQRIQSRPVKRGKTSWPVWLFLLALVVPWIIYIGPMRMSLYRFLLLIMVLPCMSMWATGKAGRIRIADIALILYWIWGTVSFMDNNGLPASLQPSGIGFVETLGAYMLGRCYVRNADDFYSMITLLFMIVAFLFPFAIFELLTGTNVLSGAFEIIFPTVAGLTGPDEMRAGLFRARTVFDHPILFGMCTGNILALVHLVLGYQKSFFQRALRSGIVAATSLCSLSAGPLAALAVQGLLLAWNGLLRNVKSRWKILIGLLLMLVLALELFAKRTPVEIFLQYLLYDPLSYWYRVLEWSYGWASVMKHPLFGLGLNDWERGATMLPSIDSFWLALAVQHGLVTVFFLWLSVFSVFSVVALTKGLDRKLIEYRTGFLITMTAFFVLGWTVAFWDHAYVLFLFVLGSGVWIADAKEAPAGKRSAGLD
jgi:hypothetical protein